MQRIDLTKPEQGAQMIREAILRGDFGPGARLPQQEFARRLGMSTTPVREAMRILQAEGLVVHLANRGFFVAEPSLAGR